MFYICGSANLCGSVRRIRQGPVKRTRDGLCVDSYYTYNAWGELTYSSGSMAEINPLRYRGYYYDTETGFYYLQSRYYDPVTHRFINADSLASTGQGFTGTNMFAYCLNNPVMRKDDSGFISLLLPFLMYYESLDDDGDRVFSDEDPIGRRIGCLLSVSKTMDNLLAFAIENADWNSNFGTYSGTFNPYSLSEDCSVNTELTLAIGEATVSFQIRKINDNIYDVSYLIEDNFNFAQWKKESGKGLLLRTINNLGGYYPQKMGLCDPYHWEYGGQLIYETSSSVAGGIGGRNSNITTNIDYLY